MNLNEYQRHAMKTCLPSSDNDMYAINGLAAEVGEIQDKIAKWTRKGWITINGNNVDFNETIFKESNINPVEELMLECGDVLWFVALLAQRIGYTLDDVAERNIFKLASRQTRGVIDGNGDHR